MSELTINMAAMKPLLPISVKALALYAHLVEKLGGERVGDVSPWDINPYDRNERDELMGKGLLRRTRLGYRLLPPKQEVAA